MMFPYIYKKLKNLEEEYKNFKEQQRIPTKKELYIKEAQVMAISELKLGRDYSLIDVPYFLGEQSHYIHTFESHPHIDMKNDDITNLVFFHGYGGTQAQFYNIYPELVKIFKVYSIDLPGMGLSSKRGIKLNDLEETLYFFIESIEKWRKNLGIDQMILVAHSFGGYIAANYAHRHPDRVQLLILLSPAGTTTIYDHDIQNSKKVIGTMPWMQQKLYFVAENIWNNKMTPQVLYAQWYGPMLVDQYLSKRLQLQDSELDKIRDYSEGVLKVPEGSERGIYQLFQLRHFPKLEPYISIEEIFKNFNHNFQIVFVYGYRDWMDKQGAFNLKEAFNNFHIEIVENAGHQLNIENPEKIVDIIIQYSRKYVLQILQ